MEQSLQCSKTVGDRAILQIVEESRKSMISNLISTVIHDINNPLTGILGCSKLLLRSEDIPDNLKELLNDIYVESVRLNRVVTSFASLCQPDSNVTVFPVAAALDEILQFQRKPFDRKGITLEAHCSEQLQVTMFRNAFQQILSSVLRETLDQFSANSSDARVCLSVVDEPLRVLLHLQCLQSRNEPHAVFNRTTSLIEQLGARIHSEHSSSTGTLIVITFSEVFPTS